MDLHVLLISASVTTLKEELINSLLYRTSHVVKTLPTDLYSTPYYYGVFTLSLSGTGTGTGTYSDIMQNISHFTESGIGKNTGKTLFTCP